MSVEMFLIKVVIGIGLSYIIYQLCVILSVLYFTMYKRILRRGSRK